MQNRTKSHEIIVRSIKISSMQAEQSTKQQT